jgi:hypothetical protein
LQSPTIGKARGGVGQRRDATAELICSRIKRGNLALC